MTTQRRFFQRPRLWGILCGLTLAVAQLFTPVGMGTAQAATTTCTPNGLTQNCTVTFDYSGAAETWIVPPGVTQATFDLYGAQGNRKGTDVGGKGGRVTATLNVTPGTTYQILVGGEGFAHNGFNGGGGFSNINGFFGNGGGASDVRTSPYGLTNRILVAGGGGGGGDENSSNVGGAGGYPSGGAGTSDGLYTTGGAGGTQTGGGAGGSGTTNGSPGTLGQGGNPDGGGGYYGGGGGARSNEGPTGGGGGSSFGPSGATFQNGVRALDGLVIISYTQSDTSAPVANPTQSPLAAPSGWNNTNVTVTWNWTDPSTGSGTVSGIDPANCTASSVSSGSGTLNLSATCQDLAGNVGTATYQVRVDPTAPTANPSQSPAANAAGWNNTDVTVTWNWVFTGAIIDTANCTTSLTSSGEGVLTLSATCKDVALNQHTVPYTVKVDKTAPVVTVDNVTDGATYTLGSVPISGCSTSDALSGVATVATFARSGGNPDGTGSFTITCSGAVDNADNSAAGVSVSYSVIPADNTAPVITPDVVGTLGTNGWYVSDVSVSWTVVDAESAISSQSGCETQNVTGDTVGVTFTCAANSTGGSSSQSVTIQRDATAPTLTLLDRTPANSNGWYNSPVTMNWRCSDATAGVYYGATIYMSFGWEGADQSTTATCIDMAGNTTSDTQSNLNIDKTKPNISAAATTAPNANGWYNSDVTVQFTCGDYLAGVATCPADQILSSEGTAVSSTAQTVSDLADNVSDPSNVITANIDKTAPVVTVTGVSNGASYTLGSVPAAGCTTSDALSGVATQATVNTTGGTVDGTGTFTATCSGATDLAGNSAAPVSVSYSVQAAGTLVGVCGGYEVRQTGSSYTAAGWSGAIKVGTSGKNTLNGGSGPDLLLGLGGNDKLDGKGGDDVLCGGDGVDLLLGMAGNDYLDGGAGNDVLNGGGGDYDQLLAGEGNDTLLDSDGVSNAQGGPGNDRFTLALRNGWRDPNGQTQFAGRLAAGYGNDTVILVILDRNPFFVDVTGDERDDPASPLEGNDDRLGLLGNLNPAPVRLKFEKQLVISAEAEGIVSEDAGADYLTEPVGEESGEEATLTNHIFLPLVNR